VYIYQPYAVLPPLGNHIGTLNRGTFSIAPAIDE